MTAVEEIRKAAALMRERAEKATPGPWEHVGKAWIKPAAPIDITEADWGPDGHEEMRVTTNEGNGAWSVPDVQHIASWHPQVAVAVADWLDAVAGSLGGIFQEQNALKVARAYLGEVADG